jgi:RimJ/RimL family protein N-acetyltransferase
MKFHGHEVVIRNVEEGDVETLVSYWHDNDPAYLKSLGVDVSKLAAREVTRSRFLSSLPDAPGPRERATFVVTADGQLVAYTNLNFKSLDEVYVHVHTLARSSLAKALVYALFPRMVKIFFESYPITRLTMQTSPENQNINRFLTSFGLTPERVYIESPDGMARPGEFNVYDIPRAAADQIQRRRPQFSNSFGQ